MASVVRVVVIALFFSHVLFGQEEAAHIRVGVDRAQVAVGEELRLTISSQWPAAWEMVRDVDVMEDLDGYWVRSLGPDRQWQDGGLQYRRRDIQLVAERSGPWPMPRPQLVLRDGAGGVHQVIAEEVVVAVDMGDPPEIPGAPGLWSSQAMGPGAAHWWWLLLLILPLAGALWWYWRRQPLVEISADQRFLAAIARIGDCESGKQAGLLLSQALRRYLGERFAFDGLGATVAECGRHLRGQVEASSYQALMAALSRLDGLRWGPQDLGVAALLPLVAEAQSWVKSHEEERERLRRLAAQVAEEAR